MFITRITRIANHISTSKFKITGCTISQRSCSKVQRNYQVQLKSEVKIIECFKKQRCSFHTSQRKDISPIVAFFVRPVVRFTAFLFGRKFRKWFARRTPEEKENFHNWFRLKRKYFIAGIGLYLSSLSLYYITHLEYDPLTGRSHFMLLNESQQEEISKFTVEAYLEDIEAMVLPKSHPTYTEVLRLTARLINANRDLPKFKNKRWSLYVIDSPMKNALVLPGGNIFVHTGMLESVENEDQLAVILGHEMAHAVLNHGYERVSRTIIVDLLLALPIVHTWAIFPDLLAGFLSLLGHSFVDVFHDLPYSRALETEADRIGLIIAAKACVDVREAVVFWGTQRTLAHLNDESDESPWLSTHPDHGDREKRIDETIEEILQFRNEAGCPALNNVDPRKLFYQRTLEEHAAHLKQRGLLESEKSDNETALS